MAKEDKYDVAIVGGGPAGIMAACVAVEAGSKVVILEKNKEVLKKFLLTGGGRCNITNAEFNLKELVKNYNKGGKFLFHAFSVFGPRETIKFFESIGIKTKIEANNRAFPVCNSAVKVRDALINYLNKNKVTIKLNSEIKNIVKKGKKVEKLVLADEDIKAKNYIFCTGGKSYSITGSNGLGFDLIKDLGHTITNLSPALTPVKIKEESVKDLQGLGLKDVKVSVLQNNKKVISEAGDILFTHFGISGPAILNMSRDIGKLLEAGEVKISIDLKPFLNLEQLKNKINEDFQKSPKEYLRNYLSEFMPKRMVLFFEEIFKINSEVQLNNISKKERSDLDGFLKNIEITAQEVLGFDFAMVTSGGVSVDEIDDKTMKSKIISNLFFAGEIIDVDAKTGGFNLQSCWSTGYLAGKYSKGN